MALIESTFVESNTGKSFKMKKGQRMRISAESIVDFACVNLNNIMERFDRENNKFFSIILIYIKQQNLFFIYLIKMF